MEVRPLSRDVLRVVERALPALAAAMAVLFLFAASAGCADAVFTSDSQAQTANVTRVTQNTGPMDRPGVVSGFGVSV